MTQPKNALDWLRLLRDPDPARIFHEPTFLWCRDWMPQASFANRPKSLLKPTSCTGAPIKAAPGLTCEAAYEALRAYAPNLPELTTVFITHSHWDHVGGHAYFRRLNPRLKFYARNNYTEEIADATGGPAFFGNLLGVVIPCVELQPRI